MSKFKIGDRIRSMDFKFRTDCFVEVILTTIDPRMRRYAGTTVRDVTGGKDIPDSSRIGFVTAFPMENGMHRDWEGRLTLVATSEKRHLGFGVNDRVKTGNGFTGVVTGAHPNGRVTVLWDVVSPEGKANPKFGATQTTEHVDTLANEGPSTMLCVECGKVCISKRIDAVCQECRGDHLTEEAYWERANRPNLLRPQAPQPPKKRWKPAVDPLDQGDNLGESTDY